MSSADVPTDDSPASDSPPDANVSADDDDGREGAYLAPHRVAFHVLVVGLCGGLFGGTAMILSQVVRSTVFQFRAIFFFLLVATVWCGLLAGAVQIARRARPALRWLAVLVAGAAAALIMTAAVVAVEGLFSDGPMEAWMRVIGLLNDLSHLSRRETERALAVGFGTLFPFVALGTARAGFGEQPCILRNQGLAAALGSLAGSAVFVLVLKLDPLYGTALIVGGGLGGAVGMAVGDVLERMLLRKIVAYRNR